MAAAPPQRVAAAEARLKSMSQAQPSLGFANILEPKMGSVSSDLTLRPIKPDVPKADQVAQKLEGVLLSNALESMLPEPKGSLFGDAQAGRFWRGLQIEAMAGAMADRNLIFGDQSKAGAHAASNEIRSFAFGGDDRS
jgi:hypothetical protein